MKFQRTLFLWSLFFLAITLVALPIANSKASDWTQFRNAKASSFAPGAPLPKSLEGENLAWKIDLEGKGLSTPILVKDAVILTSSGGAGQRELSVISFSRKTGKQNWKRTLQATGNTTCFPNSAVATPTPTSDGKHILALYSSNDVVCLDLQGRLLWYRGLGFDYPNASNSLGMASSPIIVGDVAICMIENEVDSFAIGFNMKDGTTKWKIERPRKANWTSPVVHQKTKDAKPLVLIQSSSGMVAIDPEDGKTIWKYEESAGSIPSSVSHQGVVYIPSNGLTAFKLSESEPKAPEILWKKTELAPRTASPVLYQGRLYMITGAGVLRCANAKNGKTLWNVRLKGKFSGTPVVSDNVLYAVNQDATFFAVQIGEEKGKILSKRTLEGLIQSSPVGADGELFLRSDKHLWKFEAQ